MRATTTIDELLGPFEAEVARLGGTRQGAYQWLAEAVAVGLRPGDDALSLAWLCVDDEVSQLEHDDPRARALRDALAAARSIEAE